MSIPQNIYSKMQGLFTEDAIRLFEYRANKAIDAAKHCQISDKDGVLTHMANLQAIFMKEVTLADTEKIDVAVLLWESTEKSIIEALAAECQCKIKS